MKQLQIDKQRPVRHRQGITFFSRTTEQRFYFLFTLLMAGWLLLERFGLI